MDSKSSNQQLAMLNLKLDIQNKKKDGIKNKKDLEFISCSGQVQLKSKLVWGDTYKLQSHQVLSRNGWSRSVL